jgi:D-glycero-beta-D-manno-heptose-7-phosphate kinase
VFLKKLVKIHPSKINKPYKYFSFSKSMLETLKKIISQFKNKKIMVIGDVMIDKYIWGKVERISPEAPVQIVQVLKETQVPGGAANVANNIAALGASVFLVGIVGRDNAKAGLLYELKKRNISSALIEDERPTIQKVRVMGQNQQLLRIDYETKDGVSKNIEKKIIEVIRKNLKNYEAVIVSDYAKGMISKYLMDSLIKMCRECKKKIIVDPKTKDPQIYRGVDYITPNSKEAKLLSSIDVQTEQDFLKMGNYLVGETMANILITRGEKGMAMFEKDHNRVIFMPTKAKQVIDVTGAGDTVIAAFTLSVCSGANSKEAMIIANHAAGIGIGKVGTATVSLKELEIDLHGEYLKD